MLATGVALALTGGLVGGLVLALGNRETTLTPGAPGTEAPGDARLTLGPEEYFYQRQVLTVPDADGYEPGTVEITTWCAADGSCRIEARTDTESYGVPESGRYGPGEPPLEDISMLSTDPEVLAGQLRARSAPGGASPQPEVTPGPGQTAESGGLWRAVTALLEMPNALPELRVAIFEVAQDIPGVETLNGVEDPAGRRAVALRIHAEGARRTLYFDPGGLQLLSAEERYDEDGQTWRRIVTHAGIVRSDTDRPTPEQRLFPEAPPP